MPAEERATARILTGNYGHAGAIDLYGPEQDLPRALRGQHARDQAASRRLVICERILQGGEMTL